MGTPAGAMTERRLTRFQTVSPGTKRHRSVLLSERSGYLKKRLREGGLLKTELRGGLMLGMNVLFKFLWSASFSSSEQQCEHAAYIRSLMNILRVFVDVTFGHRVALQMGTKWIISNNEKDHSR